MLWLVGIIRRNNNGAKLGVGLLPGELFGTAFGGRSDVEEVGEDAGNEKVR